MTDTEAHSSTSYGPEIIECQEQAPEASTNPKEVSISEIETTRPASVSARAMAPMRQRAPGILRVKIATPRDLPETPATQPATATITHASQNTHQQASTYTSRANRTEVVPPEILALMEAEQRRAADTDANFRIGTAAMNGADSALNPLINGQNKSYIDSMRTYLRAAIAQFISKGPGSSASALPPRPAGPIPRDTPPAGQINRLPNQAVKPVTSRPTVQKTWATVTKRG